MFPIDPYFRGDFYSMQNNNMYYPLWTEEGYKMSEKSLHLQNQYSLTINPCSYQIKLEEKQSRQQLKIQTKKIKSMKMVCLVQQYRNNQIISSHFQFSKPKARNTPQKEGRNAISNLLRLFFRRLDYKLNYDPQAILKIMQKLRLGITFQDFINWVKSHNIDHRNYLIVSRVRSVFIGKSSIDENAMLMRVILKDFLRKDIVCCYLTSRRIQKTIMRYNLESARNVLISLFNDE